jgi:FkbM family methyltransferase
LAFNVGKMEAAARKLFLGSKFYSPLRSGYQFLFDRERFEFRRKMRKFFAPFIQRDDLVFDVGAHIGRYSEIFSDLGGRVISIEPNPYSYEQLKRLSNVRNVQVEHCAAGDLPGKLKLRVCEDSVLSTVADDYYEQAKRSSTHKDVRWFDSVEVQVVTLDQLAERYGIPAFVKIDAEGYDDRVLRGMSFRPKALTFEYARILPEVAARCFATPVLSSGYTFNFSRGLELKYSSERWMTGNELWMRLPEFIGGEEYGDVTARLNQITDDKEARAGI